MLNDKIKAIADWLQKEYQAIRTGRATPSLLDNVKVSNYGALMPIQQVANIGVEDTRTLRISPWDNNTIKDIERAIIEADLGVSVAVDDSGLRAIFPELTGERREQLMKLAKSKLEEARVSVRNARDEAMKEIEAKQKAGAISEDEKFSQKEAVQKTVDQGNKDLEALYEQKEKEMAG